MARSPYTHDITFIVSSYMAIADEIDIKRGDNYATANPIKYY